MYEQVDFHFRYQPGSESPYALLLKYLQPKKKGSKRGKGIPTEDTDESAEFPRERMTLSDVAAQLYSIKDKLLKTQLSHQRQTRSTLQSAGNDVALYLNGNNVLSYTFY